MKYKDGYPVVEFPIPEDFWDDHKEHATSDLAASKWNAVALYDLHLRIKALEEANGKTTP